MLHLRSFSANRGNWLFLLKVFLNWMLHDFLLNGIGGSVWSIRPYFLQKCSYMKGCVVELHFFPFLFVYQVSFIIFKHLRLQHRKSDMRILFALSPTWYLTKICAAHMFVVLGYSIEQGNLIMFYFCFTNDICLNSSKEWNY